MKLKFYNDPDHGWLAVKIQMIKELGLLNKISRFSYVKGQTIYLEEDCDAPLFTETLKELNIEFTVESKYQEKTPIRYYESFNPDNYTI